MSETEEYSGCLIFYVNSKKVVDENPDPGETLLSYLRNKLRLVGDFSFKGNLRSFILIKVGSVTTFSVSVLSIGTIKCS